jgi:uncharacterized membrane protein
VTEPTRNPHQPAEARRAEGEPSTRKWKEISFLVFLIWSAVGLFITGLAIRPETVLSWGLPDFIEGGALAGLYYGDLIFMIFASLVVAQSLLPRLTLRHLFLAFLLIAIVSGAVETMGTLTGMPFGDYSYTRNMGPRWFGIMPAAIPLAWWVVVAGFTVTIKQILDQLSIRFLPGQFRSSSGFIALLVAAAATAFDWVMEPYAWHVMEYWIWNDGFIPWQNYASWFVLAYFLTRTSMLALIPARPANWRPTLVIGIMLFQFLLGRGVTLN